ncbi:MAG: excalibur calcium-binding domain-containing protein [Chloroflexota bacterium]|nr:excalibur calcium-binding domain-containing protein [Chloroflexota bacterium]
MTAAWRFTLAAAMALVMTISVSAQITIAPEYRCSAYDRSDYSYPQSIELRIIAENLDGKIISPYTGEVFTSRSETDIEHIVAVSEAHDSGLCAATVSTRRRFAQDLQNLTLASPSLNRHQKSAKDLAEWTPTENVCWFAQTVVTVKAKYGLSMDNDEATSASRLLTRCNPREECQSPDLADTLNCYAGISPANNLTKSSPSDGCFLYDTAYVTGAMNIRSGASVNSEKVGLAQPGAYAVLGSAQGASYCWLNISGGWIAKTQRVSGTKPVSNRPSQPVSQPAARQTSPGSTKTQQQPAQQAPAPMNALALYDDNGNGRITCAEARGHGIAPVRRGHPAYQYMNDRDNDGIVCE